MVSWWCSQKCYSVAAQGNLSSLSKQSKNVRFFSKVKMSAFWGLISGMVPSPRMVKGGLVGNRLGAVFLLGNRLGLMGYLCEGQLLLADGDKDRSIESFVDIGSIFWLYDGWPC